MTKSTPTPTPTSEILKDELSRFLKKRDLDQDVNFYTTEQWAARGESVGNNAIMSLTFEGPLYRVMNCPEDMTENLWQLGIYSIVKRHNCYAEMGYAWSLHIYPE